MEKNCSCCGHSHVIESDKFIAEEHIMFREVKHVACLHRDGLGMVPLTAKQVHRALMPVDFPMVDDRNQDWD